MESLCTVEQYVARYGSVPDEAVLAEALLDSSAAVIAEVEAAGINWAGDKDYRDRMMRATRSIARRAIPQATSVPFGATQFSRTEGPFTASVTMGNPYGDVFLSAAERRMLGLDRQAIGCLRPVITDWEAILDG